MRSNGIVEKFDKCEMDPSHTPWHGFQNHWISTHVISYGYVLAEFQKLVESVPGWNHTPYDTSLWICPLICHSTAHQHQLFWFYNIEIYDKPLITDLSLYSLQSHRWWQRGRRHEVSIWCGSSWGDGVMYEEGGCPFYLVIMHCSTSGNMLFMRRTISCPPSPSPSSFPASYH